MPTHKEVVDRLERMLKTRSVGDYMVDTAMMVDRPTGMLGGHKKIGCKMCGKSLEGRILKVTSKSGKHFYVCPNIKQCDIDSKKGKVQQELDRAAYLDDGVKGVTI